MEKFFKLSCNRECAFVERDELAVIERALVDRDRLANMQEYLSLYGGVIYIEDREKLVGIMTSGNVRRSLAEENSIDINQKYFKIWDQDLIECNTEYFENFFNTHERIYNIPLISGEHLVGEYRLVYKNPESNHMRWKAIESTVHKWFEDRGLTKIWFAPSKECTELSVIMREKVVSDLSESDICIVDQKTMRIQLSLPNSHTNIRSIHSLYYEVIVQHVLGNAFKYGIPFYLFETPIWSKMENLSSAERYVMETAPSMEECVANTELMEQVYGDCDSRKYMASEVSHNQFLDNGLYFQMADTVGKYLNIQGGYRQTLGQPERYQGTIWCFGVCTTRGAYVSDDATIETYLQEHINREGLSYRVVNCGVAGQLGLMNDFRYILYTHFNPNDLIVCIGDYGETVYHQIQKQGGKCFSLSQLFKRPHNYGRWFLDNPGHPNPVGNRVIADYIYKQIGLREKCSIKLEKEGATLCFSELNSDRVYLEEIDLHSYLQMVRQTCEERNCSLAGKVGAIVMNCNPFTLGHRYLIETASSQVDTLIVFVVEEDKSFFPFQDRIRLVRRGCVDLQNVVVVPSGKFVLSATTFPDYFNKEALQEIQIDTSQDVKLFAGRIAPAFNIGVRFAGEEPFDAVTRQYNHSMAEILPQYGIDFWEIPRKMESGEYISASRVRALLQQRNYSELTKYVPESTMQYLLKYYLD